MFTSLFSLPSYAQSHNIDIETDTVLRLQVSEQLTNVLASIKQDPSAYEYTNEELENAYIGKQFQITDIQNLNSEEKLFYYPIIFAEKIIGIISIIYCNGMIISISAGRSFSDNLNDFLNNTDENTSVALFCDNTGIKGMNQKNKITDISINPENEGKAIIKKKNIILNRKNYILVNDFYEENDNFFMPQHIITPRAAQKI